MFIMKNVLQNLRKSIFWDVGFKASTLKDYPLFVIVRVFERRDVSDIRAPLKTHDTSLLRFYNSLIYNQQTRR
jgi:hypothetical protein